MELILIVAMAKNRIIGCNNAIPWHIPEEIAYFKKTTLGHAVIMGRKTYDSIARPLPERLNVVLSRNTSLQIPGCQVARDLPTAIASCSGHSKIFIIGGKSLYQDSLALADTILLSVLDRDYLGDTSFPQLPPGRFQLVSLKKMGSKSQPFTLHTLQRLAAPPKR